MIFATDSEGRWTLLNTAWTSITGFEAQFAFGPIDTTTDGLPAIQTVSLQKFNGAGYANVEVVE